MTRRSASFALFGLTLLTLRCNTERPARREAMAHAKDALLYPTETIKVVSPEPASNAQFGNSIAVSGDTAVIGSPGGTTGNVWAFTRSGSAWTMQQKLTPTGLPFSLAFGSNVALSGNIAVANGKDVAHVFERTGTTWSASTIPAPDAGTSFSVGLAVSGSTIVVSAPMTGGPPPTGAVYVFVKSGSAWTQQAKLMSSDATTGGNFGGRLAMNGDTVVVGASSATVAGKNAAGAAYVYTRSGTTWTEQTKLIAPDGAALDYFGTAVAISGDTALIGASYAAVTGATSAGAVYVFTRSGTTWSFQTKLTAKTPVANDNFGHAVALAGDTAVIGAPWVDLVSAAYLDAGVTYVFRRTGTTWAEQARLTAIEPQKYGGFGRSVAIDVDRVFASSSSASTPTVSDAGAMFAFLLAETKGAGVACTTNPECTSGFCVDNVCCDKACGGPCEACSATKKGSGADGACGSIAADTDPKAACASGTGTCAADGMCDGAGNCRSFAKAGTPCGATTCATGAVTGKVCKGSSAECLDTTTMCAPYACGAMACKTTCAADTDCAADAYCSANVCKPRAANGASCGAASECASNYCVDGVCCNSACTGQCESCAEDKGNCLAIKGEPRAPRMACGGDAACAGACNGINGGSCTFKVGSECASSCAANSETISTCDMSGACKAGASTACPGYSCDGSTRCRKSCTAPSDCLDKYSCIDGKCAPATSTCSSDNLSVEVDGKSTSCGATICRDGKCVEKCTGTADCAPGYVCNAEKCERAPSAETDDGGGCSVGQRGASSIPIAMALLILGMILRRRALLAATAIATASCSSNDPRIEKVARSEAPIYGTDITKVYGTDTVADDFLGHAVARSGDYAIVTAINASYGGFTRAGAGYVFLRSGTTWTQQAKLTPIDPKSTGRFGESAVFSTDLALIGSGDGDAGAPAASGTVYVFQRAGTTWSRFGKVNPTTKEANARFGISMAISGTTLVVGAPGDTAKPGAAFVFTRSGTTWTEQAKLVPTDGANGDSFGYNVAIDNDTVMIGATGAKIGTNSYQGAVYAFTRSGTTWSQQAKITPADGAAYDQLGGAVAISGDTALFGMQLAKIGGKSAVGAAYVYTRSGTTWSQQTKLTHAGGIATDLFGSAVALSGDTALIGATALDVGITSNAGGVFLFTRSGTTWTENAKIVATDPKADRSLGRSVAFEGEWAIAGDSSADVGTFVRSGAAYAFRLAPSKIAGAACGAALECASGFCVDGVCCDKACAGSCEACSATKKGSGVDGACAPVAADTDPRDGCAAGTGTCPADGMCDGAGNCRSFAKAGTPCGSTTCTGGAVSGKVCKGSTAECADTTTMCAPYACGTAACKTSCAVDGDCAADAYCAANVCKPKAALGAACGMARECGSGTCVDGVCCDKPCTGQCESCAETKGTCLAVKGAPRGSRMACGGGTACAGSCNGTNGATCTYPVAAECASTCSAGSETVSACDATGACVAGAAKSCGGFACDGTARCRTKCTSSSECEDGYQCTAEKCEPKPAAKCSDDGLSVVNEGKTTSCGAMVCRGGKCLETCNATSDCAPTYLCDGNRCTQPASAEAPAEDSGGCGVAPAGSARSGMWMMLALAVLARRRVKR